MRIFPSFLLFASLLTQAACYRWVPVDPADAQKLSGSFRAPAGPNTVAIRVVQVQQPDGRLVELEGDFDVRVSLKGGAVYELKHPVAVEAEGDELVFRGGNRAPVRARREDIAAVEASKMDEGKTVAAITAGSLAGAAVCLLPALIVYASK